jgi:hypothetical protein
MDPDLLASGDAGRLVFKDNIQNPDINNPESPVHMELIERLCTGWFDLPPGSPKTLLKKLPKGTLLGVTINPVTRVIFEIWQPHEISQKVGCPGKPIWGVLNPTDLSMSSKKAYFLLSKRKHPSLYSLDGLTGFRYATRILIWQNKPNWLYFSLLMSQPVNKSASIKRSRN